MANRGEASSQTGSSQVYNRVDSNLSKSTVSRECSTTSLTESSQSRLSDVSWSNWQNFTSLLFYMSSMEGAAEQAKVIEANMNEAGLNSDVYIDPSLETVKEVEQRVNEDEEISGLLVLLMGYIDVDAMTNIIQSLTKIASLKDKPKVFLVQGSKPKFDDIIRSDEPESEVLVICSLGSSPFLEDFTKRLKRSTGEDIEEICKRLGAVSGHNTETRSTMTTTVGILPPLGETGKPHKFTNQWVESISSTKHSMCNLL